LGHHSPQPQAKQSKSSESSVIFVWNRGGCDKAIFGQIIANLWSLKRCDIQQNLQQGVYKKLYIPYRLVTYSMTSHDL